MCGLVGFYPKKNKKVDLSKLYPLWILNEERGTHSCGISYGGKRETGINTKSKARDLIVEIHEDIIKEDLTNKPIICHTRHATNGTHSAENAHPFRWHREQEDNFFTFAHNGVIRDLWDFKKKLGMHRHSEKLMTIDSQVLGLAMYDAYTNILTEKEILTQYEGNAAFLCFDKNNVFKAWKGANLNVEERPLYYIETKDGWYFSSIGLGLAISFLETPILIPNNTLLTFKNHKLVSSEVFKREIEPVFTKATSVSNSSFKDLVTTASSKHKTTGFKIVDNAIKLTLKSILSQKKSKEVAKNTLTKICMGFFATTKGKYCIGEGMDAIPITGVKVVAMDISTKNLLPFITDTGRLMTFQNGVVVQPGSSYYNLQGWYENRAATNTLAEDIFNEMYEAILKTIVDYIPFYKKGVLHMVVYLNNNKLDYISSNDKISTQLPSIFNKKHTIYPNNNILYINELP